jgi:phosphatidylglycerophosphate synthase
MDSATRFRWFWVTQALSIGRVVLAFLFVILCPFANIWPFVASIYIVALATDYFDGRLARSKGVTSRFGGAMDLFGDRYLTIASLLYAAIRGVSLIVIAAIILRELYSLSMRMVTVQGHAVMVSSSKVGGLVLVVIAFGTLNLLCHPHVDISPYYQAPFVAVAVFYVFYLPWTLSASWSLLWTAISSDLESTASIRLPDSSPTKPKSD